MASSRYRFVSTSGSDKGKAYTWSYAQLSDTLFESDGWDTAAVAKRVKTLPEGKSIKGKGGVLTRENPAKPPKVIAISKDRYRASAEERRRYGGSTITEFYVKFDGDDSPSEIITGYGKTPGERKTDAIRRFREKHSLPENPASGPRAAPRLKRKNAARRPAQVPCLCIESGGKYPLGTPWPDCPACGGRGETAVRPDFDENQRILVEGDPARVMGVYEGLDGWIMEIEMPTEDDYGGMSSSIVEIFRNDDGSWEWFDGRSIDSVELDTQENPRARPSGARQLAARLARGGY